MPKMSVSDFASIVSASGTSKVSKIADIKGRGPYSPATDFYKGVREGIVDNHTAGGTKKNLASILANITDPKKTSHYPALVAGYKRWWGTKSLTWFDPPAATHTAHGIDVAVNPELGLEVNGVKYVIKLHFVKDALSRTRAAFILHLMTQKLTATAPPGAIMSVLDVRNAKLKTALASNPRLAAAVNGELSYIAEVWPTV
jgi:hypothetical protein